METVKESRGGIGYLTKTLKDKPQTITEVCFWKIKHKGREEEIHLKIGRYKKGPFGKELEESIPKSELTLDGEEFKSLIDFIGENHQPFKDGAKSYITLDEELSPESAEKIKAVFSNPNQKELLSFIISNKILPSDLVVSLQYQDRVRAIAEFEEMLSANLTEHVWQAWLKNNSWILGSEFVKILDEREIDTANISDYLMEAYDGFLDIIEIKRPSEDLQFWSATKDHGNFVISSDLVKAITQSTKYIYEVEKESNSDKFIKRMGGIRTIKPRCVLIFGRSNDWDDDKKEAYRILNSSYHDLTILTYDHVLNRAKTILGLESHIEPEEAFALEDIPF